LPSYQTDWTGQPPTASRICARCSPPRTPLRSGDLSSPASRPSGAEQRVCRPLCPCRSAVEHFSSTNWSFLTKTDEVSRPHQSTTHDAAIFATLAHLTGRLPSVNGLLANETDSAQDRRHRPGRYPGNGRRRLQAGCATRISSRVARKNPCRYRFFREHDSACRAVFSTRLQPNHSEPTTPAGIAASILDGFAARLGPMR